MGHALPLADGGRHAHRAAADEQRRARRLPGAGRGARRHAVAAHELDGRDARAADRSTRCRSRCARSRCSRTRPASRTSSIRSAARTTSRRSPTSSSARPRRCSRRSTTRAAWCTGSRRAGSSARSPSRRRGSSGRSSSTAASIVGVNEFVTDERRARRSRCSRSATSGARAARARLAKMRADARQRCSSRGGSTALQGRGARDGECLPAHSRLRARLLHAVRDPRGARGGVRRVPRAGLLLTARETPRSRRSGGRSYFDAQYLLEYEPIFSLERDRAEVARLIDMLGLPAGARILDVPCGQGRHAHLLAEAGFDVDGLDYSTASARRRARARHRAEPALHARRHAHAARDAGPAASTPCSICSRRSASSLDPADDARVDRASSRACSQPGGVLVWHGGSRDGVMARFLDARLVAVGRRHDDRARARASIRSRACSRSTRIWSGTKRQRRARAPHPPLHATRLAELCADAGLIVEEAYDGWSERAAHAPLVARCCSSRARASWRSRSLAAPYGLTPLSRHASHSRTGRQARPRRPRSRREGRRRRAARRRHGSHLHRAAPDARDDRHRRRPGGRRRRRPVDPERRAHDAVPARARARCASRGATTS